jgi:hypothetical protein
MAGVSVGVTVRYGGGVAPVLWADAAADGFDQHYNVQAAVDQDSMLIVATSLSNHPNDKREAESTLDALSPRLGKPSAAALDNGFFSEHNVLAFEQRAIEPYIATGHEAIIKT